MDASPLPALGLPRQRRIKQGRDFARARNEGRRLACGCLILNWVGLPARSASRLGVITGRRIGNAVVRSRARRLLREAFRVNQTSLTQPVDVVLVARPSIVDKPFKEVARDYLTALRRAGLHRAGPDPTTEPSL
jgi:ribonuclease P protein component